MDREDLIHESDEMEARQAEEHRLREAANMIVQRLSRLADDTAIKRKPVERRWIAAMCQFYGVRNVNELTGGKSEFLSGEQRKDDGRSSVFVNLTRPKTNRLIGRLFDILFPADDKNWAIEPTPDPELTTVAKVAMDEANRAASEASRIESGEVEPSPNGMTAEQLLEMAGDLGPQGAEAAKRIAEAKQRAERMATVIDDQLLEARFAQKSRDALEWAGKIGIGVLKGPVVMDGGRTRWTQTPDGYQLQQTGERARPTVECVSPWSFFPDPSATSMDDAEFVFERHLVSKKELRSLGRKLGFYDEPLRELIKEGPTETTGDAFQHLRDMRMLTGEDTDITNRYVVWEYHGSLECDEIENLLKAAGEDERAAAFADEGDPFKEYRVVAWFCNGKLLKMSEHYPMDSGEFIYSVYSVEKGAASILGALGVPDAMADSQEVLNGGWRMMMDNAKLSVGPQVLIDKSRVQPADGDWTMYPGKEWLWDSNNGQAVPPFQTFNIPMNQEQIAGIIGLARSFIDDETAMPSVIEGGVSEERAPGAASTMGGFAMLLNSAGVNVRRMVKNWDDDVTTGMIRRLYDWNMQYSDRDEIKGDMQVEPRGTAVLLVREMQAQNLAALAANWTVHPVLGPLVKAYDMARLTVQAMNINPADVIIDQDEYQEKMKALSAQQEPEDPQWAARMEIAQIQAETARYNSDAEREVAMMRLAQEGDMSIAQIQADLEKVRENNRSKERLAAAEIGIERQNKAEAEAMGRVPTGSGGLISLGSKEP